jgi:YhcH/YjgK/YiaL family protein
MAADTKQAALSDLLPGKYCRRALLLLLFSVFYLDGMTQVTGSRTTSGKKSRETAQTWMEHGQWRDGLSEKPNSDINAQTFSAQYHKHQIWWDKAFAFLNRKDLISLAPGSYPIVGKDVYASITEFVPKDFDKSGWESHRRYADIQCMIRGEEKIGKAKASDLTVTVPYNSSRDAANYKGPGKYYVAQPGTFFLFFPGDAHRPDVKVTPSDTARVKKIVIKVRVTK